MRHLPLFVALLLSVAPAAIAQPTGTGNSSGDIVIQLPPAAPRPRPPVRGDADGDVIVDGCDFCR
ncbi:MAG: hypothetical protein KDK12_06960 [Rhodobacteraceae bacterium]|nr:hypothetical protein [Paracoccaceae bacterium]